MNSYQKWWDGQEVIKKEKVTIADMFNHQKVDDMDFLREIAVGDEWKMSRNLLDSIALILAGALHVAGVEYNQNVHAFDTYMFYGNYINWNKCRVKGSQSGQVGDKVIEIFKKRRDFIRNNWAEGEITKEDEFD